MEVINVTGVTKTNEARITRAVGALNIQTDCTLAELTNETITIFVEQANGSNTEIANKINLKDFILASTFGSSKIKSSADFATMAICEIASGGSILLDENESIKVQLNGLKSSKKYIVDGIEIPEVAIAIHKFDRKTINQDESNRSYNVEGYDLLLITKSNLVEIEQTFSNDFRAKYSKRELEAISFDVEDIITVSHDGKVSYETQDRLVLPLQDVSVIEVEKSSGVSTLTVLDYQLPVDYSVFE